MVQWLRLRLTVQGLRVWSLLIPVKELRSHIPHSPKTKNIKQRQYCNKFNKNSKWSTSPPPPPQKKLSKARIRHSLSSWALNSNLTLVARNFRICWRKGWVQLAVSGTCRSWIRVPLFWSWLYPFLSLWPWAEYLISLCLSFLICEIRVIILPTSCLEAQMRWSL